MKVTVLEEKKNRLVFSIEGAGHTLCNALREELWNDESTKAAGYHIAHPLTGIPYFVVETEKNPPRKVVSQAIKRLDKQVQKIQELASKEL